MSFFQDFKPEIRLFLLVALIAVAISIAGILLLKTMESGPAPSPTPTSSDNIQTLRGMLKFEILEGFTSAEGFVVPDEGCWYLEVRMPAEYPVRDFPGFAKYELEGLSENQIEQYRDKNIEVRGRIREDMPTTCQLGTIFEVQEISYPQTFSSEENCEAQTGLECRLQPCLGFEPCSLDAISTWAPKAKPLKQEVNNTRVEPGWETYLDKRFWFEFQYPQGGRVEVGDAQDGSSSWVYINFLFKDNSFVMDSRLVIVPIVFDDLVGYLRTLHHGETTCSYISEGAPCVDEKSVVQSFSLGNISGVKAGNQYYFQKDGSTYEFWGHDIETLERILSTFRFVE